MKILGFYLFLKIHFSFYGFVSTSSEFCQSIDNSWRAFMKSIITDPEICPGPLFESTLHDLIISFLSYVYIFI
jgi:hypothetical protein